MNKAIKAKNPTAAGRIGRLVKVSVTVAGRRVPRLPHERDESADNQGGEKRKVIQQASADIKRGLKDTDRAEESDRTYRKLK